MANSSSSSSTGGIGFFGLLAILFIALKLTGYIAWSWWWVLAPMWMPISLLLAVLLIWFIVYIAIQLRKERRLRIGKRS